MAYIAAKRIGTFIGTCIDKSVVPFTTTAAVLFSAEYVLNAKMKPEIKQALERVLEREREQVLESQRAAEMKLTQEREREQVLESQSAAEMKLA